ncbi:MULTISPECIES: class I SAM-dependent methyltransferase [Moorena]|uniref:Methyltransferase domain protein n=1 Tax=Moorena producens 3L TaxID=489825 RepID=F4XSS0_9CYAN|nr:MULTISPECIES: class I SAM-dependent methyltransferase [Moorena]EGJ32395.1 methyltransferase domain protein [Moorena producens 3L]
MQNYNYAYNVFKKHFDRAKAKSGFVSLELGVGDSLSSAIISYAFGGSASYLVDVGDFAQKDIEMYKALLLFLDQKGLPVQDLQNLESLPDILNECSANYLTSGLSSLKAIPDQSVDFIWSHAVLEHIRRGEFLDTFKELRRVIRDDGICSHEIDLKDHLAKGLNNLRFPEQIWESDFMSRSGFYTNRIQYTEMISLFKMADFDVEVVEANRWPDLPIKRANLSKLFQHLPDEELCVSEFSVILKPV